MVRLFVRHNVADYAVWRQGYDDSAALRDGHGVKADSIHRSVDDGNDITVTHDFESVEAARAFAGLPELKATMDELGVVGAPSIWFTQEA